MVKKIENDFGKIDVLINNAGFGLFGTTEETTEQMETNFFGSLWVVLAVLPVMRKQESGHIIQTSSFLGLTTLATKILEKAFDRFQGFYQGKYTSQFNFIDIFRCVSGKFQHLSTIFGR